MKFIKFLILAVLASLLFNCSKIVIEDVNYAWRTENRIKINSDGLVKGPPFTLVFDLSKVLVAENVAIEEITGKKLRIIRNQKGFYFLTAPLFKKVYVFAEDEGALKLKTEIAVAEAPMENPAFNLRGETIQLITDNRTLKINENGIVKGEE